MTALTETQGATPIRVLVVARWYPSHDAPGRGIFIADLVRALTGVGVEPFVVSWELALATGAASAADPRVVLARDRWAVVAPFAVAAAPRSWGAPGVPVVRLPAIVPTAAGVSRDPLELADLQAATLVPFGVSLARRWPYGLVHAHTGAPDGLAAARLADELGLPLLVSEHDSSIEGRLGDERLRTAYRGLLEGRRRLVAVSPSLRDALARTLGVDPGRIGVLPNPVDVAAFHVTDPPDREPTELLWVGARKASKGTDTLLRAFARVRLERPELRLRLIGSAPGPDEESRLRSLAALLGLGEAVSFEPPGDRPSVAAAMARAAVFVHPSPRETFGVVAAEALAAGLPVAATPSGGVEGILGDDGRCGTIAADTGEEALALAIAATLDRRTTFDPSTLRARASGSFAPSIVAASAKEAYSQLGPTSTPRGPVLAPPPGQVASLATPLIVGLRRRSASSRLGEVPTALAAGLEIVTSCARPGDTWSLPPGRWSEVDAERIYAAAVSKAGGPVSPATGLRRISRALLHPLRTYRLRHLAGLRDSYVARERLDVIVRALDDRARRGSVRRSILALDADDVVAVVGLLDSDVTLEPGTLRGLVDAWDAAGRPSPSDRGA